MSSFVTPPYSPVADRFVDASSIAPSISPISCASSFSSTSSRHDRWTQVFDLALKSVVHITTNVHVNFDTHTAGQTTATGFVVDAENGIILSNRHVMTCAPATHRARFQNTESVRLMPWYYDPVFDFAFFKYNPKDLRIATPEAIRLVPEKAVEGLEIRVISCDAGQPISVSTGTIADTRKRPACAHCCFDYHEFNTFYCVAAAGTSGGSSGAPVLDIEGDAVALNVGGISKTQQSLFLPLHRIVKTLNALRQGSMPMRGTLQTMFQFEPNEFLIMAGLPLKDIYMMHPALATNKGILRVDSIVPESPVAGKLMVGDYVFAADSQPVLDFETLLDVLDGRVGESVILSAFRDSALMSIAVPVTDLYRITPSKLLRIGTGCSGSQASTVFCDVSYVTATTIQAPLSGVLVCGANTLFSSAGINRGSIITSVNGAEIKDLADFEAKLLGIGPGTGMMLEYLAWNRIESSKVAIVPALPNIYTYDVMQRDPQSGYWSTKIIRTPADSQNNAAPLEAIPVMLQNRYSLFQRLHASVVHIRFHSIASVGSASGLASKGYGFVASKEHGIIVCDKSTVPSHAGSISVTIANSVAIEAWVDYIDPVGCFAYLRYDTSGISSDAVEEAPLPQQRQRQQQQRQQTVLSKNDGSQLRIGDNIVFVVPTNGDAPILYDTQVEVRTLVPLDDLDPSHEQILNIDALFPKDRPNHVTQAFICNPKGNLCGMWVVHANTGIDSSHERIVFGVDIDQILPVIERLKSKQPVRPKSLNVEFSRISLLNACVYGLSNQRASEFSRAIPHTRSVYVVCRAPGSSSGEQDLRVNDIVLKINGRWVDSVSVLSTFYDDSTVELLVCRGGKELVLNPTLLSVDGEPLRKLVHWSGMCIEPYNGLNHKKRKWPSEGVCITNTSLSSPASCIHGPQLITHINGRPVKNMDDLVIAIKSTHTAEHGLFVDKLISGHIGVTDPVPGSLVAIKTLNRSGTSQDIIIETDELYYPSSCLELPEDSMSKWVWKSV
ncbi:hypothetical protein LPJ53_004156 [Coemansia erecta]|uniref:PDZ-like domain-containing protein n=1 Tax=Coemansia erecta TaxID=147472 RepID=A0A9W8CRZ2_9FUNG|nr:hypothetical protein LPJ53_004156 [Coemansia erecta]